MGLSMNITNIVERVSKRDGGPDIGWPIKKLVFCVVFFAFRLTISNSIDDGKGGYRTI